MIGVDVLVVGGGMAGLYLSYTLKKCALSVKLIEASGRAGGRILTLRGFCDWPLEAGAAYVHGKNSVLHELAQYKGIALTPEAGAACFIADRKLYTRSEALEVPGFEALDDMMCTYQFEGKGTLAEWPLPSGWQGVMEGFSAIFGTSAERLTLAALRQQSSLWASGQTNDLVPGGFDAFLGEFVDFLGDDLVLDCPAESIGYSAEGCRVSTPKGVFEAKKVAVCVPLGVLKARKIAFEPALSRAKLTAIDEIGFDAGAKVFLKFSQRFWPESMGELYGGTACALYAVRTHQPPFVLEAFVMGPKATRLMSGSPIQTLLAELDEVFAGQASAYFLGGLIHDWGGSPWVLGAYTYPTLGSHLLGQLLAIPENDSLFFAGEHTHPGGHQGTVHGAMEAAEITAKLILESLDRSPYESN